MPKFVHGALEANQSATVPRCSCPIHRERPQLYANKDCERHAATRRRSEFRGGGSAARIRARAHPGRGGGSRLRRRRDDCRRRGQQRRGRHRADRGHRRFELGRRAALQAADGRHRAGARGSGRHPGDRRRRQGRHLVLPDDLGRPADGQYAVDAHRQRGGCARRRHPGAAAAAAGRRVHLHGAHDARRLGQDRAADPRQGGQGRARRVGRRARQLQREGADRSGARRARAVRRDGQWVADPERRGT